MWDEGSKFRCVEGGWVVNRGMEVEGWEWVINSRINLVKLGWCWKNVKKFWGGGRVS